VSRAKPEVAEFFDGSTHLRNRLYSGVAVCGLELWNEERNDRTQQSPTVDKLVSCWSCRKWFRQANRLFEKENMSA